MTMIQPEPPGVPKISPPVTAHDDPEPSGVGSHPGVDRTTRPLRARAQAAAARTRRAGTGARRTGRRLVPFAIGAAAMLVALLVFQAFNPPPRPITQADVRKTVADTLASQSPGPALSEVAYGVIQPSLVLIQATHGEAGASSAPSSTPGVTPSSTPGATPSETPGTTLGSGVVVDDAGDILTALHVVRDATRIEVTFADGSTSTATIADRTPETDIAVLAPDNVPAQVVPAVLGGSGGMRIGSDAFVVGNPFGLTGSMSAGVVSGLDRSFKEPGSDTVIHGLIQVDAAVNPGNSGGPLLDRNGLVVGVVTALINPTADDVFIGIGLAVPIEIAGGGAGLPPY